MFTEIEHTADYAILVQSADLVELFFDAARGMYSLTGGTVECAATRHLLHLTAPDIETLLVEWLEELALLLEAEREMAAEIDFSDLESTRLVAQLKTGPATGVIRLIKAVTFHDLEIRPSTRGYEATIVFDV